MELPQKVITGRLAPADFACLLCATPIYNRIGVGLGVGEETRVGAPLAGVPLPGRHGCATEVRPLAASALITLVLPTTVVAPNVPLPADVVEGVAEEDGVGEAGLLKAPATGPLHGPETVLIGAPTPTMAVEPGERPVGVEVAAGALVAAPARVEAWPGVVVVIWLGVVVVRWLGVVVVVWLGVWPGLNPVVPGVGLAGGGVGGTVVLGLL